MGTSDGAGDGASLECTGAIVPAPTLLLSISDVVCLHIAAIMTAHRSRIMAMVSRWPYSSASSEQFLSFCKLEFTSNIKFKNRNSRICCGSSSTRFVPPQLVLTKTYPRTAMHEGPRRRCKACKADFASFARFASCFASSSLIIEDLLIAAVRRSVFGRAVVSPIFEFCDERHRLYHSLYSKTRHCSRLKADEPGNCVER